MVTGGSFPIKASDNAATGSLEIRSTDSVHLDNPTAFELIGLGWGIIIPDRANHPLSYFPSWPQKGLSEALSPPNYGQSAWRLIRQGSGYTFFAQR